MFSVIDFVPLREHSLLRSESTSKALTPFFGGKVFDAKRGARNNNCGLKELMNIEITKDLIF
jgi:hypothetical protein